LDHASSNRVLAGEEFASAPLCPVHSNIGGDNDIALQQQTGFLFAVGPREGAQLTSQPQMGQPVTPRLCSCAGSGLEVTVMPLAMAA
jgi:hypothetical protein